MASRGLAVLLSKPIVKAAATSAAVLSAGDVLCQVIQGSSSSEVTRWDMWRTARFGIVGASLHGPLFYTGFRIFEARFGKSTNMKTVLSKVVTNHCTLFPAFHVGFFAYMGLLEGCSVQQVRQRFQDLLLPTMATGTTFWPLLNVVNFKYVPQPYRVLYVSVGGMLWNAYLSWVNTQGAGASPRAQQEDVEEQEEEQQEGLCVVAQ